jgi:mRNA-degrading endonuclease toxin of MazEF toxin-antitoxin module
MRALAAGQIVVVDWRDALPRDPNKQRPAVVVEDTGLFDPSYPNVLLVPLADDVRLAIPDLAVAILPTPENGCSKPCYALAHHVTATSKQRVTPTDSQITSGQLAQIRKLIAVAIGLD